MSLRLLALLALGLLACGDDTGSGGGGSSAEGSGGSGAEGSGGSAADATIEGTAFAFLVNESLAEVTVALDGPQGSLVMPPGARVEVPAELHLRACDEGLCARFDFGTEAGPSEVASIDGDVMLVLGPPSIAIVRSRLVQPEPGHAVVSAVASSTNPQTRGVFGHVGTDGIFVPFALGIGESPQGAQIPAEAVIAFQQIDGTVLAFGGAFQDGAVYAGLHLPGNIDTEVNLLLCPLQATGTCVPYVAIPDR